MIDFGPPPKLWLPPKPAIIRPADAKPKLVQASFLPGMFPAGAARTRDRGTLSIHSATSSFLSASIAVPGTVVAGDLLVYYNMATTNTATIPTSVTPSGFTLIGSSSDSNTNGHRCNLSYKLAVGTEGGTNITGMNENTEHNVLFVFRGSRVITAVAAFDYEGHAGPGAGTAQVVSSGSGLAPLVVIAGYSDADNSGGTVSTRGFSPDKDAEQSSNNMSYGAYKIYNSAPADVTVSKSDDGNVNNFQSCYITATM